MHISSSVRVGSVFGSVLGQSGLGQAWDRLGTGLGQSVLSQSGLGQARVRLGTVSFKSVRFEKGSGQSGLGQF